LIEAQYLNLPVAASAIAPHFEAVYSGYHSFMYNSSDVDQAAKNIGLLLNKDNQQEQKEATVFSAEFSIENMAKNLFNIYSEVKL
jgi:hypothetical protein